jgi:hypothetical protein
LLEQVGKGPRRKTVLIASLAANLGFLGFFKYYNFLAANVALAAGLDPHSFFLDIVLPLGISFHTFQSMSYVVDVYRDRQPAVRNPVDYALFICFFPQLVAGPIVRARDFFRDLWAWQPPSSADVSRGVFLIALGLTKKMAFADQFAKVANLYFGSVAAHPGRLAAWSGVFAFALQIYFDFSGYTDMAIGMAKLFGFHFPINFRRPYLAASITDFWRTLEHLPQPHAYDAARRAVAWRQLEFSDLGRLQRRAAGYRARDTRWPAAGRGVGLDVHPPGRGDLRPGADRVGILPCRRPWTEHLRAGTNVRRQVRASVARTLALRTGSARPDSIGWGGKVGVVRARHAGAAAGLRVGVGRDAVLSGNLRRFGRSHSVHLLPVLAANRRRRLHHGKQQTNHHEDCEP